MRLVIDHQPARIGINTQNAQLTRSTTLPKIELKTEQAKVDVKITLPKVQIDQKQCFAESGLKGILQLASENASNAVGEMYASVGRIAEQGNALTDIHNGGNPIADQAYYNAYDQFDKDFNLVTMPKSRPKITLVRGELRLQVKGGTVEKNFVKGENNAEYQPGKVEIYMLQKRQFEMRFEKTSIDLKG